MSDEEIAEIYFAAYDDGWYHFVEGFDFPDYVGEVGEAEYDGFNDGWSEVSNYPLPIPKFVEEETSRYFNKLDN
jgi:hypothetical protein